MDHGEGGIALAALDAADVGSVDFGLIGKGFLCVALLRPEFPDGFAELGAFFPLALHAAILGGCYLTVDRR